MGIGIIGPGDASIEQVQISNSALGALDEVLAVREVFSARIASPDFRHGHVTAADPFDQLEAASKSGMGGDGVFAQKLSKKSKLGMAKTTVVVALTDLCVTAGVVHARPGWL